MYYKDKGLYRQLEEQILKCEKLEKENTELREENNFLRAENKRLNEKIDSIMESLDARIAEAVEKAVAPFKAELALKNEELKKANAEILRLKSIINKDSSNSSKPPSTNGFKVVQNSREQSNKKPGGQFNHEGHRIQLPENIDELIEKGYLEKRIEDHTNGNEDYVIKYVLDIETKVICIEHRYPLLNIPTEMQNEVTYGDNVKAEVVYLNNEGIISRERLVDYISGITHGILCPSEATIGHFICDFSEKVGEELEVVKTDLLNGKIMNTDETPMRCTQKIEYAEGEEPKVVTSKKTTYQVTIRTHSNDKSTLFTVNPKKDIEGIERDGILTDFHGILIHDHDKKLYNFGKEHGACVAAHLARDLKGLKESYNCDWAKKVRDYLLGMNTHKNQDLEDGKKECDSKILKEFCNKYDLLVEEGEMELTKLGKNGFGYKEIRAMVKRLQEYKEVNLAFMKNYQISATNNLAERDLRPCKTKQKVSGCFRSWDGIVAYAKTRSFISTVKKRGLDVYDSICKVIKKVSVLS